MRKQVRILRIDPELQALSTPISAEEYRTLEDSIQLNGCLEPLTVWNRTIVDGYKRYAICVKYSIPFAVERMDFDSRDAAAGWLIEQQLSRPGLGAYERAEIVLRYGPFLQKRMIRRKAAPVNGLIAESLCEGVAKGPDRKSRGKTRDRLAAMAGVSHGTLDKVKLIDVYGDEAIKARVRCGELSIHRAFCILWKKKNAWRLGGLSG